MTVDMRIFWNYDVVRIGIFEKSLLTIVFVQISIRFFVTHPAKFFFFLFCLPTPTRFFS